MKYIVRFCLKFFISILDTIIPKEKKLWVFYITPRTSWDANMQCVFAEAKRDPCRMCVVIHLDPQSIPKITDTPCYSYRSLPGFWRCLKAGAIFFDHSMIPGMTSFRRKNVNLWHGIPIKKIRYFCKDEFPPGYLHIQSLSTTMLISSSPADQLAMAASFQISPERVVITGLPRNDLLLKTNKYIEALPYLANEKAEILGLKGDRKLLLYAPTYRDAHQDASDLQFKEEDEIKLGEILEKHNAILGIRDHPFSNATSFPYLRQCKLAVPVPIKIISNTNFLLTFVDILITDYSSIWVDFLLLRRPIIGFCPDLDSYLRQRGFIYDFKNIFPGSMAFSVKELAKLVDLSLTATDTEPSEKQDMICNLFHKFTDGLNTERVLKIIQQQ